MNVTDYLLNYLQSRFSTSDCVRVLKDNNLYCRLGERIVELTEQDIIDKKNNMIVSKYNFNVLSKIIQEFNRNNIEAITFKGTTLSYLLFGVVNNRMPGDIDLFTSDYNRALETLIRMGFYFPYRNKGLDNQHHISLTNGTAIVELHKNIFTPAVGIDEKALRSSVESIKIMNTSFCTFTKTFTLLHLLYHLYMDVCLAYWGIFPIFVNKQFPKVKRFIYRAYEIALFSERFFNEINWTEIEKNISCQKLRIVFKKIIVDILSIFPMAFPPSFVELVNKLNYNEDERDKFYKYLFDQGIYGSDSVDQLLCSYINDSWSRRQTKNIHKKTGERISFVKKSSKETKDDISCDIYIKKIHDGVELRFKVSNNDFYASENQNFDTQATDGVHLLLCGTEKYSYSSIFFFPKKFEDKLEVVVCDVLNNRNAVINNGIIRANISITENEYTITAILSNEFLVQNNLDSYFYMGVVISDCSSETRRRKNQLILSAEESQWYNPIYFAKVDVIE